MQVTQKIAKQGSRLVAIGNRLRDLEDRIARVRSKAQPDPLVLRRLTREKLRLRDEVHCHAARLRNMSQLSLSLVLTVAEAKTISTLFLNAVKFPSGLVSTTHRLHCLHIHLLNASFGAAPSVSGHRGRERFV